MLDWRPAVGGLTDYFERDATNERHLAVAEIVYFIGEVEVDGLLSYLDRRGESHLRRLRLGAEEVGSKPLIEFLPGLSRAIDGLPCGESYSERISLSLEKREGDPFAALEQELIDSMSEVDTDLLAYFESSGVELDGES